MFVKYYEYILSEAWEEKSKDIIIMRGLKCEYCGECKATIEYDEEGYQLFKRNGVCVHHLHYNSLGYENYKYDVRIACKKCHKKGFEWTKKYD